MLCGPSQAGFLRSVANKLAGPQKYNARNLSDRGIPRRQSGVVPGTEVS